MLDIYYVVLKDGSLIVDQYVRNDSLERPRKRLTKTLSRTAIFKSDRLRSLFLFSTWYFFIAWPVLLCSRIRYASISLALYLDD